jgi:hypothetical protein
VIKFVSDLRQVGGQFSSGTPVFSTNKTDRHEITEIFFNVALSTIKQTNNMFYYLIIYVIYYYLQPFVDLRRVAGWGVLTNIIKINAG